MTNDTTGPTYGHPRGRGTPTVGAAALCVVLAGCASNRGSAPPEPTFDHRAEYRVSCNVSDECRVQYIDEGGVLRARDVVGEWTLEIGVDVGSRMWLRAWGGGCPPRPLRVSILLDGTRVADTLERASHQSRCDWLQAETEFVVP